MWKIVKLLLFAAAPLGLAGYGLALYVEVGAALEHATSCRLGLAMVPAGIVLWLVFGRFLQFFHVFEHELTHLVTGLLFFIQPRQLVASESGGRVEMYGNNFLVSLTPYFLPLLSLGLMLLMPVLDRSVYRYACGLLGTLTGYHLVSNMQEFSLQQPDIRNHGRVFSALICLWGNIVALGCVAGFLRRGWPGSWAYLQGGYREAAAIAGFLARKLYALSAAYL